MKYLRPPIREVKDLFEFLAEWRGVPTDVPAVTVPRKTPSPLRDLYLRFGTLAASERWVRPDLCWSEGLFSGQNFLVAPTQLGKDAFVASTGALAGKSLWLILRENQHCWFAYAPIDHGEDPPVVYTDVDLSGKPDTSGLDLKIASRPLSEFLATHVLIETVFASPRLWCIGDKPFGVGEFSLPLTSLWSGRFGHPELQYDFLVDPTEQVLIMTMPESNFTWVASCGLNVDKIAIDPAVCEDCRR